MSSYPPFPFLRLPLELRIEIYKLVVAEANIHLGDSIDAPIRRIPRMSSTRSGRVFQSEEELLRDRKMGLGGTSRLAIAFSCRQIYLEAAEIYYGSRLLHFRSTKWMELFIETIGSRNKIKGIGSRLLNAIRHIRIGWWDDGLLALAAEFPRLVRLDIGRRVGGGSVEPKHFRKTIVGHVLHELPLLEIIGHQERCCAPEYPRLWSRVR